MKHEFKCKFKGGIFAKILEESKRRGVSVSRVVKDCVRTVLGDSK